MNDLEIPYKLYNVGYFLTSLRIFYKRERRTEKHTKPHNSEGRARIAAAHTGKSEYVVGIMNITVQLLLISLGSRSFELFFRTNGRSDGGVAIISSYSEKDASVSPICHKRHKRHIKSSNSTFQFYAQSQP